jgi:hypothetical protein
VRTDWLLSRRTKELPGQRFPRSLPQRVSAWDLFIESADLQISEEWNNNESVKVCAFMDAERLEGLLCRQFCPEGGVPPH